MVCVEINLPYNKSFLVSTWYRPPNASINVFEDYTKFVGKCDFENKQLIVLGDMNCDYFKNPSESHTQRLKFISVATTDFGAYMNDKQISHFNRLDIHK
jgi:hypothetical protein